MVADFATYDQANFELLRSRLLTTQPEVDSLPCFHDFLWTLLSAEFPSFLIDTNMMRRSQSLALFLSAEPRALASPPLQNRCIPDCK